jgi:hypothetical protein
MRPVRNGEVRVPRGVFRRAGWGLLDQVASSGTNFAVGALVARTLSLARTSSAVSGAGHAIRRLVDAGDLQLGLFDERNLAEIRSPEFPGERLVVCRNPVLAAERARKREALLLATEGALGRVVAAVSWGSLRSAAAIGLRAGRVVNSKKMAKYFELTSEPTQLQARAFELIGVAPASV